MMELTMKKYLILAISIFLSMESNCVPVTHTSNLTDLHHETTTQPAHEHHRETETAFISKHSATKTSNSSRKPAEISTTAQMKSVVSPTIKSEEISNRKYSTSQESRSDTAATVVTNPVAPTTTSSESQQNLVSNHSPVFSTAASHNANISEKHLLPQQPDVTSATPPSETTVVSLWQGRSTTKPQVTPKLWSASPTSQNNEKHHTPSTTNSETSQMIHTSSSLPVKITDTSTTRVDPPSTSKSISSTMAPISPSKFHGTTGSAASATSATPMLPISTNSETTASTSLTPGVLIPVNPRKPTTTKLAPATKTVPHDLSKSPSEAAENRSCSTHSTAKQCLIAIASLAVLATIFMVSTIVLCTKLSSRKYRSKKQEQGTEMMCISSLLTERHYSYSKQCNPVRNGILVIPSGGDSDEDGGDNLTLSSFLPENDRL
ncbi:P-selectin glycoprotein ligand 1 [Thalassophryne amazonica]|uniref:P-selectin glycoprotein ligand 1 n=1 Tax=Thalassophryne amazonica TaxID=390379 RepID=UPI001470C314|nr:P-selectin glycoprotein ligand 1 [Thalassophryne amazonica]